MDRKFILSQFLIVILQLASFFAYADAPTESKAVGLSKIYANGNYVKFSCNKDNLQECEIFFSIDKREKSIDIDLSGVGIFPDFDFIKMNGQGSPFIASVTIGFRCRQVESALIESAESGASCRISFMVSDDDSILWTGIEIFPVQESLYRSP